MKGVGGRRKSKVYRHLLGRALEGRGAGFEAGLEIWKGVFGNPKLIEQVGGNQTSNLWLT